MGKALIVDNSQRVQITSVTRDALRGMLHHELDRLAGHHADYAEARNHIDDCLN